MRLDILVGKIDFVGNLETKTSRNGKEYKEINIAVNGIRRRLTGYAAEEVQACANGTICCVVSEVSLSGDTVYFNVKSFTTLSQDDDE